MQRMLNVARLVGVCGEIEGRKKLQKIVHILREAGYKSEFGHQFGYLHYGPYSRELRNELDALTEDDALIHENQRVKGSYTAFVYSATEQLGELLRDLKLDAEPSWAGVARELNGRESQDLEALSTAIYLQRLGYSGEALRTRFEKLKPSLKDRITNAVTEADRLAAKS